jgi:hypothetical protein
MHWERVKAVDYGYAAESCCLWGIMDQNDGTLIIYRELYKKGLTGEELGSYNNKYGTRRPLLGLWCIGHSSVGKNRYYWTYCWRNISTSKDISLDPLIRTESKVKFRYMSS